MIKTLKYDNIILLLYVYVTCFQHCMKGWNTNQPSAMPASSNIALRDSTTGLKAAMKTVSFDLSFCLYLNAAVC